MSAHPTINDLKAVLHTLHDEAGGMLHLDIVTPDEFPQLALATMRGDPGAKVLLGQVRRAVSDVHGAPRRSPKLCGSCPRRVRRGDPFSIAIATPACDDPTTALALVICLECGPDRAAVQVAAARGLQRVWPDLRNVAVTHSEGGRA